HRRAWASQHVVSNGTLDRYVNASVRSVDISLDGDQTRRPRARAKRERPPKRDGAAPHAAGEENAMRNSWRKALLGAAMAVAPLLVGSPGSASTHAAFNGTFQNGSTVITDF